MRVVAIRKSNASAIAAHNPAGARHYGAEKIPEVKIGNHVIGQSGEKSNTLALLPQLLFWRPALHQSAVHYRMREQSALATTGKKVNFFSGIDIRSLYLQR